MTKLFIPKGQTLFIAIVTFNSRKHIIDCLLSLKKVRARVKMVIVDNGSTDRIGNFQFPASNFQFIQNKKNLGFAAGSNVGIKYALKHGATHVLLLNPDTIVGKNFLEPLLENGGDIVGPVGGRVNFLLGRPKHTTGRVDFISGACMLVKREVFEKVGYLDERFFLYFEDVDFCLRAKKAGFLISVVPQSHVVHHTPIDVDKPFVSNLHLLKSNFIFINRWVPLTARPFAYFYWFALSSKILLEYILKWILHKS